MRQATPELIALDQYSAVDSIRHQWDALGVYREEKSRAAARFRLRPNSSTMLFYDALHGGESNAGAFELVVLVKALERREQHKLISYRIRRHCLAYDPVSVYNPLAVFRIARQAPIRKEGDEQQQGRSRRYATDELALESQKCTQTFLC